LEGEKGSPEQREREPANEINRVLPRNVRAEIRRKGGGGHRGDGGVRARQHWAVPASVEHRGLQNTTEKSYAGDVG